MVNKGNTEMQKFVFARSKMNVDIYCYETQTNAFTLWHDGKCVHATSEDLRSNEVAQDAAFFTAWNVVTGFEPFNVVRRLSNGKFRKVGNTTFVPAGKKVVSVKAGWHSVKVKFV
jgi:hypothetical protein